jgi:hypothetical protein
MVATLSINYLKEMVEYIQKVTGSLVCIAGGAPRDLLNDKPVKDIDVFLPMEGNYNVHEILNEEMGFELTHKTPRNGHEYSSDVYEGKYEGYPWQFILMPIVTDGINLKIFTEQVLTTFDYCICQVAVTPYDKEDYASTDEYERNIADRVITRNPDRSIEDFYTDKAINRIKKLCKKYPEFAYVPPEPHGRHTNTRSGVSLSTSQTDIAAMSTEELRLRFNTMLRRPTATDNIVWNTHTSNTTNI